MTGFPLTMTGWDRTYQPPRALRATVAMNTTAWDLLRYQEESVARQWATTTLDSLIASVDAEAAEALGCTDCQDTGYYGVQCPGDEDMLTGLVRRIGDEKHEALAADGSWAPWLGDSPLEILTLDVAGDLAAAITGGACGLVRRYLMPRAFLPPCPVVSSAPLSDALTSLVCPQPPENTETSDNDWVTYAIVDELDPGAVLDLVRVRAAGDAVELERCDEDSSWTPDSGLLAEAGLPTVRLTESQLADVQEQLNPSTILSDGQLLHCTCSLSSRPLTSPLGVAVETNDSTSFSVPESTGVMATARSGFQGTADVLAQRDSLQMRVMDAQSRPTSSGAYVVDGQAIRNRLDHDLVHHPVDLSSSSVNTDQAVSVGVGVSGPDHTVPKGLGAGHDSINHGDDRGVRRQVIVVPPSPVTSTANPARVDGLPAGAGPLPGPSSRAAGSLQTLGAGQTVDGDAVARRACPIHGQSGILSAGIPGIGANPKAEVLRRYWSTGRGAAKIRWNTPGDWKRCVRHLTKYMGIRARGYCQLLHKRNDGVYTGDRRNPGGNGHRGGHHLLSAASPEEQLLASVRSGQWGRDKERNADMPLATELLTDGIYYEGDDENAGILRTLTAGGFPVAPPDEWYADPKLPGPTPMVVEDNGRVFGHLATWDVTHIGMAGATHAPRSPSNYAYFLTGSLKTKSGKSVNVGQLTLAGGHADINGNAQAAVQHYDDTNSAVADVMVGEDQYGIWAAGGMRPNVTPEQVRVFRASPPSGDWRPINGHLEMVACCSVNVPGFMNVRPTARVAGGAVLALVAAGTRELNEIRQAMLASPAVVARLETLEARVDGLATPPVEPPAVEPPPAPAVPPAEPVVEPVVEPSAEPVVEPEPTITANDLDRAQHIARVRDEIRQAKRAELRSRMQGTTAAGKVPPQFKKKSSTAADDAEDKADKGADESSEPKDADDKGSTIKGTDSFPIKDVASLKKAIQAFGRAGDKPAAKKHITSMAFKLHRPDLIPANWKS